MASSARRMPRVIGGDCSAPCAPDGPRKPSQCLHSAAQPRPTHTTGAAAPAAGEHSVSPHCIPLRAPHPTPWEAMSCNAALPASMCHQGARFCRCCPRCRKRRRRCSRRRPSRQSPGAPRAPQCNGRHPPRSASEKEHLDRVSGFRPGMQAGATRDDGDHVKMMPTVSRAQFLCMHGVIRSLCAPP